MSTTVTGPAAGTDELGAAGPDSPENPHAGQGAVVVDIGGDVGALVVTMPLSLVGREVEIAPAGHGGHSHSHDHDHGHGDGGHHHPHVAVVRRPLPDGRLVPTLVYGSVLAGSYDLSLLPDGDVELTVDVRGGHVSEATWPGA